MKKLNILFSNSNPVAMWGGGEKWMVMAAKGLQERGHNCIMAARGKSQILRKSLQNGLKTKIFELHSELNIFKIFQIAIYLKRNKIDVVVLNITKDVRMVGIAARLAGVKLTVARHGAFMISDKFRYKLTYNLLVDKIITNSNSIKNKYETFGWLTEDKIKVIANGVELPENIEAVDLLEKYKLPKDCFIFGAFGRLADDKGYDTLIKAAKLIENYNFAILIAGEGNQRNLLESLIKTNELDEKVFLLGHLDDVYPYMKSIDILILSSTEEGMPNAVLEAMLLGKPVVSTDVNDMPNIVEDKKCGLICHVSDKKSLASKMELFLQKKVDVKKFGFCAKDKAEKTYTVKLMVNKLEEFFVRSINEK